MSELKEYFRTGRGRGCTLDEIGRDTCRRLLQKAFWSNLNEAAKDKFRLSEVKQRRVENLDAALCGLGDHVVNKWATNKSSGRAEVKLENNSYWITLSKGNLYVTSSTMKTFRVVMPQETMVQMLFAYDAYIGSNDIDIHIENTYREFMAEEKAKEVLTVAVKSLVEDVWFKDVSFSVRQQKNGRLCCTLSSLFGWSPDVVFKTDMVNFRDDFIKARQKFECRRL